MKKITSLSGYLCFVYVMILCDALPAYTKPLPAGCISIKNFVVKREQDGTARRIDDNSYEIILHLQKKEDNSNKLNITIYNNDDAEVVLYSRNIKTSFIAEKVFLAPPEGGDGGNIYYSMYFYHKYYMIKIDYKYSEAYYSVSIDVNNNNGECI